MFRADGLLVAPGFIDLQCNGAGGIDLSREPERLWEVATLLPQWGVTAWAPTIVSSDAMVRDRAIEALRQGPPNGRGFGAIPLGLHFEGPFLHHNRRGAHRAEMLVSPDPELIQTWSADNGVGLVTLAPELAGGLDLVRTLVERGIVVAVGHSDASAGEALLAIDSGVSYVTHLFNAMAPFHHRNPGLAGIALADERVRVSVIADGIHLHPVTVALAQRALGSRLTLVTDSVSALGAPGSMAKVMGEAETVVGDSVRLPDGTLTGTVLSMDQAVRNLVAFSGCSVDEAVAAASTSPAAVVGAGNKGLLREGCDADLVVLTPDLRVVATILGGEVLIDMREGVKTT